MNLDRGEADPEAPGDQFVGKPFSGSGRHLGLARGKARKEGRGRETFTRVIGPDAVYVETLSGRVARHVGRVAVIDAIARLAGTFRCQRHAHPGGRVETVGDRIVLRRTCLSSALPGGQGQGINCDRMRDGLIAVLKTTLGWESCPKAQPWGG